MRDLPCPRRIGVGWNFDSGLPHETRASGLILNPVVDRSFKKRLDDGYAPLVGRAAPDIVFTIVGRSPTYLGII